MIDLNRTIFSRDESLDLIEHYQESLADLNLVINLDKQNVGAITNRAMIYLIIGHRKEALADFDQVITLDEKNIGAIIARAIVYQMMGRYEEALADFNRAIVLDEKNGEAITNRGETCRLMKRYQEALADFDRAIALDEKFAWAIACRGETYRQLGRYQDALADFDRAISLSGKEYRYWYHRALVHLLVDQTSTIKSDLQTAIELAQTSLQNNPDNQWVDFNVSLFILASGDLAEAESRYNSLFSLF